MLNITLVSFWLQPQTGGARHLARAMRITNNIIQLSSVSTIQKNLREMHASQESIASGLRIQKASDDPVGASESMRARGSLRGIEQYRRGIQTATSRARAEESALDQLSGLLMRAKELAITYGSDTADAAGRRMGQVEAEGLLREAVSFANVRADDTYLFGGVGGNVRPYAVTGAGSTLDFTSTSPSGQHSVEVSESQRVVTNHNGTEVFEGTGLLAALRDLALALSADDTAGVRAVASDLDSAFDGIQSLVGEIGARTNLLDVTAANLDALEFNLLSLKSEVEEVDLERTISELVGRQTTYQAALMATSKVMSLTLADYMR